MKRDRFYKTSPHSYVGNNVSFYAIDGHDYVTDIDKAHIYTREEAQAEIDRGWLRHCNNQELFLSADHVDEVAVWHVDTQYVKYTYPSTKDPMNEYVAYKNGMWDGNNLAFASLLSPSFDYSQAIILTEDDLRDLDLNGWTVIPKFHTDEIARRTFQKQNINRRKMITAAGLTGIKKITEK
ncbi:hypothetical protein [Photobacterium leiognathi]|uniref:hypothetical protein n=1 Tax=Photobacterium leiognathi TaxID=553611 RepID=UPI002739CE81|nr:hypothetical protein [Photobacterium leiognathi]